jgi:hypothetical protein
LQQSDNRKSWQNMNIELKEKVEQYIDRTEGEFYPDDISRALNADFQEIMDICKELIEEEKIEIASWKADTFNKIPKEKIVLDSMFRFKDPISFDEAKGLLNISEKELRRLVDNYEYKPTAEDISIANKEELEQLKESSKMWQNEKVHVSAIDLVGELRNWMHDTDVDIIDEILEFMIDQGCLNDKGKNLRHHFWERYLKKDL